MKLVTNKFKSGGLHEKHVLATWNLGNHLSICLQTQGNQEKPVSRWPVAGPSEYWLIASSPASKVQIAMLIAFPLQQWLRERTSMSLYKYTACPFVYMVHEKPVLVFNFRIILFWLYKKALYRSWTALIVHRRLHMIEIKPCNGNELQVHDSQQTYHW